MEMYAVKNMDMDAVEEPVEQVKSRNILPHFASMILRTSKGVIFAHCIKDGEKIIPGIPFTFSFCVKRDVFKSDSSEELVKNVYMLEQTSISKINYGNSLNNFWGFCMFNNYDCYEYEIYQNIKSRTKDNEFNGRIRIYGNKIDYDGKIFTINFTFSEWFFSTYNASTGNKLFINNGVVFLNGVELK